MILDRAGPRRVVKDPVSADHTCAFLTVHTAGRNVSTGPGPNGKETQLAPSLHVSSHSQYPVSFPMFLYVALALDGIAVLYSTEEHDCDLDSGFSGVAPKVICP